MHFLNYNGRIIANDQPVLMTSNRGFLYGDGVFETMKIRNSRIQLAELHFQRLFTSLQLLQFDIPSSFTKEKLENEIIALCQHNQLTTLARVRLTVSRGNGSLYGNHPTTEYLIESFTLTEVDIIFNKEGLSIGVYREAIKSTDRFANLKSTSFLPYVMAIEFAKANQFDDCLLLNSNENIADTTIANIFMYHNGIVSTPSLDQGCVNGVQRRFLLDKMKANNIPVVEKPISVAELKSADEVFLSNAIKGIRWVKYFGDKTYTNRFSARLYARFMNEEKG